jgi:hypothetical protein
MRNNIETRSDHLRKYTKLYILMTIKKWSGKKDLSKIIDKDILDLGSGSDNSQFRWQPHFARKCSEYGANVIALDKEKQSEKDSQLFSWDDVNLIDLVIDSTLSKLPTLLGKKFVIINSTNFVGFNPPPSFKEELNKYGISKKLFEDKLLSQLEPLLVEGGIISLDQRINNGKLIIYRKINGIIKII